MEKIEVVKFIPYFLNIDVDDLTITQRSYINRIEKFKKENSRIPTIREIVKIMNASSTGTVSNMILTLRDKGYDYKETCYKDCEEPYSEVDMLQDKLKEKDSEIEKLQDQIRYIIQDRDDNYRRLRDEELL